MNLAFPPFVSLFIVLISYISSLSAFRLDMPKVYKQFSFLLLFILLGETFGIVWMKWFYVYTGFPKYNPWFYNIFHFICYVLYLRFFYAIFTIPWARKLVKLFAVVYVVFALTNYFFFQGMIWSNTHSELLASLIMISLSLVYYYQLLQAQEIISPATDRPFWISSGLFTYHLGTTMALVLVLTIKNIPIERMMVVRFIVQICAIIMYLMFTIAFLCHRKK